MKDDIICGTQAQIASVTRATLLFNLLKDDQRFTFQGRTLSHVGDAEKAPEIVANMAQLIGIAGSHFVRRENAMRFKEHFSQVGLKPIEWDQYWGQSSALASSKAFLEEFSTPPELTLKETSRDTDDDTLRKIAEMSLAQGVLSVPGSVMRGEGPRGVMLYAETSSGEIASCGGGFMAYHPSGPKAKEAFWGLLATAQEWRGHKLACWLGAEIVVRLSQRYGATGFSTGVKADNPASQAMCNRLGITKSEWVYAAAVDPILMGDGPVTR